MFQSQVALLTKLIQTAKSCDQIRNYATCISILDGLENVLVRQLPVSCSSHRNTQKIG